MSYILIKSIFTQKKMYNQEAISLLQKNKLEIDLNSGVIKSRIIPLSLNEMTINTINIIDINNIYEKIMKLSSFDIVNLNISTIVDELHLPSKIDELSLKKNLIILTFQIYLNNKKIRFEDIMKYSSENLNELLILKNFFYEWQWLISSKTKANKVPIIYTNKPKIKFGEPIFINNFISNKLINYLYRWKEKDDKNIIINKYYENLSEVIYTEEVQNYTGLSQLIKKLNKKDIEKLNNLLMVFGFEENNKINSKSFEKMNWNTEKCWILYYIDNDQSFDIRLGEGEIVAYFAKIRNGFISQVYCTIFKLNIQKFFEREYSIIDNMGRKWIKCTINNFI